MSAPSYTKNLTLAKQNLSLLIVPRHQFEEHFIITAQLTLEIKHPHLCLKYGVSYLHPVIIGGLFHYDCPTLHLKPNAPQLSLKIISFLIASSHQFAEYFIVLF